MSEDVPLGAELIRAAKLYEEENAHLLGLIDRLLNAGVTRWHDASSPDSFAKLSDWLELSDEEYSAWVEGGANGLALYLMQDTHTIRIPKPACPTCDQSSISTAYTSTWHEHTCANGHTWRIA